MSSLRLTLTAQLARFDDEAFAALANRGLLRRAQKDLEKQTAEIVEESADTLIVGFGGHRIGFDARGPSFAQCSCPATGLCQHILAAAIALRQLAVESSKPAAGDEPLGQTPKEVPGEDHLAQLHSALLAMNVAQLSEYAGRAGYRWAWQYVQDLGSERPADIRGERYILIGFKHPRISFRYMGGGVESLIADVEIGQVEKYRVAAVLAYQRANGVELPPPEAAGKGRSAGLNFGKDHALPESAEEAGSTSRARLRASVIQLLQESVQLGLSHLSQGIQERYATLAVWAQGAEYYRLAMLLRRLADHVEMLLERAGSADEHRLLDEIALVFALVSALEQAARTNAAPVHLVGQARSRYEQAGTLELIGLGANAWRSAAGYIGLTMMFWSVADGAFVSCTDARPEIQRGFNPIARYKGAGPWAGLGAPAQSTGRRLVLADAQLNAQGRLSAAESTSATIKSYVSGVELCQLLKPATNWSALVQARSLARRSLLAEPSPMRDWAALQPARFGRAQFDAVRQTMVWPVFDDQGQCLNLQLAYSDYASHAIERVEQLEMNRLPDGTIVIARLHSTPGGPVGEPLSLVRSEAGEARSAVDALHFDPAPVQSFTSKWRGKLLRAGAKGQPAGAPVSESAVPAALRDIRHWLQRTAERGISSELPEQTTVELQKQAERAAAIGLSAYSRLVHDDHGAASAILRNHYLCMQYEHLLVDESEEPA